MRLPLLHGAPRSPARTAFAAAAMVGLLAVAAVATRGDGKNSTAPPGTAAAASAGHHVFIVAAVVLTPILAVLGMALFFYAQIYRRRELDPEAERQKRTRQIRFGIVAAACLAALVYWLRTGHNPLAFLHLRNPFGGIGQAHAQRPFANRPGHAHAAVSGADWTVAVIVWAALAIAAVVIFARSRGRPHELAPLALADEAEASAEPDLDRLRRERNPRRAVIAAYAAMERHMAGEGLPRGAHEAPMEYLGRVTLQGHERVACVHRLTALFQWAKFSHRPVDDDMRSRAIAAVEELTMHGPGEPA
jgi:Domain of unknown function (DUF4129)